MIHPRQTIRNAVVERLRAPLPDQSCGSAGPTAAGCRVFSGRVRPLFPKDLPAILVYARQERADPDSRAADGQRPLRRRLDLAVEIVAMAREDLDDALDSLAAQVEARLDGFEIPTHRTARLGLTDTEIDLVGEGEQMLGAARLTWTITYYTPSWQDPDAGL